MEARAASLDDLGPPWEEEPEDEGVAETAAQPSARQVVSIPVREPGLSPRLEQLRSPGEAVSRTPLVPTPEGDFWFGRVTQLVRSEAVTALVRELALQSQLVARDADQWLLRVERESLNQGNTRERLAAALHRLGDTVQLGVEIGPVNDSAALRQAAWAEQRQREAEQIIQDDPFVQAMMRDFGGKIVPGTLKSLDASPLAAPSAPGS
jgi:DNA polymerase III subunit gamma/tau